MAAKRIDRGRGLRNVTLIGALAWAAVVVSPCARGHIGELAETCVLDPANTRPYGLAYCTHLAAPALYVSDSSGDMIYAYTLQGPFSNLPGSNLATTALHGGFIAPRGLAYDQYDGFHVLYAVTSNDYDSDGDYTSRLWRVDLDTLATAWLDLDDAAFGIAGREMFGLACRDGHVLVSYDTTDGASEAWEVQHGIVELKVREQNAPNNWWTRAGQGDSAAVVGHLPHSGRALSSGTYSRAPAFGLACAEIGGTDYFWATSYNKYIYAADADTGRGLFCFGSPGQKRIYGLAFGGNALYAVDYIGGGGQIHKVTVAADWDVPVQGDRVVRHLKLRLKDTAAAYVPILNLRHNFAQVHRNSRRPSQGRDAGSFDIDHNGTATVSDLSYDPAGDSSVRQDYYETKFSGSLSKDDYLESSYEADVWTSDYRQYVYPHLCDASGSPASGYTDDDYKVYRMTDQNAYDTFITAMEDAVTAEYGAGAVSANPYWLSRNIMEFVAESYYYGDTSDWAAGHYTKNPANFKLELLFDGDPSDDALTCSSAAFAMAGVCRYNGLPARWVGTTKWRGDDGAIDLLTAGMTAVDDSFHRWPEVWLGNTYGWQRFDPTPMRQDNGGPRQFSQYELMAKSACGVSHEDLVLTIGSGYEEPFFYKKDQNQRYNSVARHNDIALWYSWSDVDPDRTVLLESTWSNACFVDVLAPVASPAANPVQARWDSTGNWALDPTATVSVYLQPMKPGASGFEEDGGAHTVASAVPYAVQETALDLAVYPEGDYRLEVIKDTDSQTGGYGDVFHLPKLPELVLTMTVQNSTVTQLPDQRWELTWTIATTLANMGTEAVPAGTQIPVVWEQQCSWIQQQLGNGNPPQQGDGTDALLWVEHVPDPGGNPQVEYHLNPLFGGDEDSVALLQSPALPEIQRHQIVTASPMQPGDVICLDDQHFVSVVDDLDQCMTVTFTADADAPNAIPELNDDNALTLVGYSNLDSCGGLYEIEPSTPWFNDSFGVSQLRTLNWAHIIPEDILGEILSFDFYFGPVTDPPLQVQGLTSAAYEFPQAVAEPGTYYWRVVYDVGQRRPISMPVYSLTVSQLDDSDRDGLDDWWETRFFGHLGYNGEDDFNDDGLTNARAFRLGLNPRRPDTDRDGMSDAWEVRYGLDPRRPDADMDLDGDGRTNFQEFKEDTNPFEYLLILKAGWSLISISGVPRDNSVAAIFGRGVHVCLCWNGRCFVPATFIEPMRGYWVYCTEDSTIDLGAMLPRPDKTGAPDQPLAPVP